jgi:RHS repeat-associated protein
VTVGTNGIEGEPGDVEARYAYDALGRRVPAEAWAPTLEGPPTGTVTRHVYGSGPEVLAEYDINSNGQETIQRWFIHGPTYPDPLVMVDRTLAGAQPATSAEYFYYLKDVLGSVVALIDSAGTVVERYDYDPYGQPRVLVGLQGLAPAALHDADADGLITDLDAAALAACGTNGADDPACVALHDLTADGRVDGVDTAAFNAVYEPGEDVLVPIEWEPIGEPIGELRPPIEEPWPVFRSPVGNPYRWTGQRYDTATALYLFHARTYSAAYGRFMQRDAVGVLSAGGDVFLAGPGDAPSVSPPVTGPAEEYPDGLSLYQYVRSSPTNATDPFGRATVLELELDVSIWASLQAAGAAAVGGAMGLAQSVAGAMAAHAYMTSVAIFASQTVYGVMDPAATSALWTETERFASWVSQQAGRVGQSYGEAVTSGGQNLTPGDWKQWQQKLNHAGEYFGVKWQNLTQKQIREWGEIVDYVSRATDTFRWRCGAHWTTARMAKINDKWVCVLHYLDGSFCDAYVPKGATLQIMKAVARLARGG